MSRDRCSKVPAGRRDPAGDILRTPSCLRSSVHDAMLVACLCADWCLVCGDYRHHFGQVQSRFSSLYSSPRSAGLQSVQFLWVDVEDEADLLHPVEVDDFPTLLVAVGPHPCFWGTVRPRADALIRMVHSLVQAPPPGQWVDQPDVTALVARLRAAHPAAGDG